MERRIYTQSKPWRRLMILLLATALVITSVPLGQWEASAVTKVTTYIGHEIKGYDGKPYRLVGRVSVLKYDQKGNIYTEVQDRNYNTFVYLLQGANYGCNAYCIEWGTPYTAGREYQNTSASNDRYFKNLSDTTKKGITLALIYGRLPGRKVPVAGCSDDDWYLATQIIIWEYLQRIRTSPTTIKDREGMPANYFNKMIKGRPAEKVYRYMLDKMNQHYRMPIFLAREKAKALPLILHYRTTTKDYRLTLYDKYATGKDLLLGTKDVTVIRNGNYYTFVSKKALPKTVVAVKQNNNLPTDLPLLIWGSSSSGQTMASGVQDDFSVYVSFQTKDLPPPGPAGEMTTTVRAREIEGTAEEPANIEAGTVPVSDIVSYKDFRPKEVYNLTGRLMKVGETELTEIVSTSTLVTADETGTGTWTLDFGELALEPDTTYVVFEKAESQKEFESREGIAKHIVLHEDSGDLAQTIITKKEKPSEPDGKLQTQVTAQYTAENKAANGNSEAAAQVNGNPEAPAQGNSNPEAPAQGNGNPETPAQGSGNLETPTQVNGNPEAPAQVNGNPEAPAQVNGGGLVAVKDTIWYENLVSGQPYEVTGRLVQVEGEAVVREVAVARAVFTAEQEEGDSTQETPFTSSGEWVLDFGEVELTEGEKYVIFEHAVSVNDIDFLEGKYKHEVVHEDPSNKAQTLVVTTPVIPKKEIRKKPKTPTTGDPAIGQPSDRTMAVALGLMLLAAVIMVTVKLRKPKRKKGGKAQKSTLY